MPDNPITIDDYEVVIAGEKYSMTEDPSPDSAVVTEQIRNTLASIKLDQMCNDLSLTGELIYCAYNGIDPKYGDLRALVSGLHKSFVDLLLRSEHQMTELEAVSGEILPDLRKVFRFLMLNKEDIAIKFLNNAASKAAILSGGMTKLSKEYKALGEQAEHAVEIAEKQQGMEKQQIEQLKEKLGDIRAQNERATELSQRLEKAVKDLQEKYEEAKSKAESSENRAFALSIIGAILKPLADGVGAAAGAYLKSQTFDINLPKQTPTPQKQSDEPKKKEDDIASKESLTVDKKAADKKVEGAKEEAESRNKKVNEKKADLESAKEDFAKAEKEVKKDGLSAQEKEEREEQVKKAELKLDDLKEQVKIAEKNKEDADKELKAAQDKAKEIGDALEKIGKSLGEVGDNLAHAGDSYFEVADSYRKEKVNFLKLLMEKQDEEDKTLADMKQYALQMKNIDMQTQTLEVTVAALFQAIGALKKVVTHLQVAAQFWQNMADGCERLAKPAMADDIEAFKNLEYEEKRSLYDEAEFKTSAVRYLAGWVGMQSIAKQYTGQMTSIRQKVSSDYGNYLGINDARQKAKELGGVLVLSTQKAEEAGQKARSDIKTALEEASAEAARAA